MQDETVVLPPLKRFHNPHNPEVCACDLVGMEDECDLRPTLAEYNQKYSPLAQREDQLREALTTIAALRADQESGHAELRKLLNAELQHERETTAAVAKERDEARAELDDCEVKLLAALDCMTKERTLIQSLRAELEREREKNAWVSVSDAMPEPWSSVLVQWVRPGRTLGASQVAGMQVAYVYRFTDGRMEFRSDLSQEAVPADRWRPLPLPAPPDSTNNAEGEVGGVTQP